jgi:pimeloyl-ACP methyl ester carboxylesterase
MADLLSLDGTGGVNVDDIDRTVLSEGGAGLGDHVVEVDGTPIWYRVSGRTDSGPPLVLVHGNGANHLWWYRMLPALEARHLVVQMDLSGHGDSGHRTSYSAKGWTDEIEAVVRTLDLGPCLIVAHSMGGMLSAGVAAQSPEWVTGLVLFDTAIVPVDGQRQQEPVLPGVQRFYESREAIAERFRLMPPQPHPSDDVMAVVAAGSITQVPDGQWTWKQDQTRQPTFDEAYIESLAPRVHCPITLVYGELSLLAAPASGESAREIAPGRVMLETVPGAHHHLVLEMPDACVDIVEKHVAALDGSGSNV